MPPQFTEDQLRDLYRDDYVQVYERKPLSRLARLLPFIPLSPDDEVADFACGNAMLLDLIHNRVRVYHGVDFSEEFIAAARSRAQRLGASSARFHAASIEDFCAAHPEAFDKAFAMDFSEHVYDEPWLGILRAMRGTLKPGGRLYLHTPNAAFIIEILKARGILHQFPEHIAVRDADANRALIEQAGFSEIRVRFAPHYVVALKWLHIFSPLPLVGRFFRARLFIECVK
jgi:2-polyprenyl-3-methyl-5-hydroxy-6-metoxy-1,4-benzoquinol methylase